MAHFLTVHLIVRNGEKYIRYCLDSLKNQTFKDFDVVVFDNYSSDLTRDIVKKEYPDFKLYKSDRNYVTWGGFSRSISLSDSKYAMLLSVDVIMDKDFLAMLVAEMEKDRQIGAAQGKSLQWKLDQSGGIIKTNIIDSTGFQIERSRRVINRGQGDKDMGQYNAREEIFGAEGACLIFRREALEDCRICVNSFEFENKKYCEISDEDMVWYGDDLDLVWRMRLLGWKQYYVPQAVMWHDRSTTKNIKKRWYDYFKRIKQRQQIPIRKRRLDWRNIRLAVVKNELLPIFNRDFIYILKREIMVLGYAFLFEPQILLEIPVFFKILPKALKKRKIIMNKRKTNPKDMKYWFK